MYVVLSFGHKTQNIDIKSKKLLLPGNFPWKEQVPGWESRSSTMPGMGFFWQGNVFTEVSGWWIF